jgi:hypothetical protein
MKEKYGNFVSAEKGIVMTAMSGITIMFGVLCAARFRMCPIFHHGLRVKKLKI